MRAGSRPRSRRAVRAAPRSARPSAMPVPVTQISSSGRETYAASARPLFRSRYPTADATSATLSAAPVKPSQRGMTRWLSARAPPAAAMAASNSIFTPSSRFDRLEQEMRPARIAIGRRLDAEQKPERELHQRHGGGSDSGRHRHLAAPTGRASASRATESDRDGGQGGGGHALRQQELGDRRALMSGEGGDHVVARGVHTQVRRPHDQGCHPGRGEGDAREHENAGDRSIAGHEARGHGAPTQASGRERLAPGAIAGSGGRRGRHPVEGRDGLAARGEGELLVGAGLHD
jgi:hypothetical protein